MSQTSSEPAPPDAPCSPTTRPRAWSGLAACGAVGLTCTVIGRLVPGLSPMLVAIILGVVVRNLVPVSAVLEPGIAVSAKRVLR